MQKRRVWRGVLIAVVSIFLTAISGYAQRRGITERWTPEKLTEESNKLMWNSEGVCVWGQYRKLRYTLTEDGKYVNNVILEKRHVCERDAKLDFHRLIDKFVILADECWVVDKWTWVFYFGKYGVYVNRSYTDVHLEFIPFFGD